MGRLATLPSRIFTWIASMNSTGSTASRGRGCQAARPSSTHVKVDLADLGQHRLGPSAVAGVGAVAAGRVAVWVAEVVGELALQGALQDQLGELLQRPVRADQADPPGAGLGDQPSGQLLVHPVDPGCCRALGLRVLHRHLCHVLVSPPMSRQLTLSWSYTVVFTVPKMMSERPSKPEPVTVIPGSVV